MTTANELHAEKMKPYVERREPLYAQLKPRLHEDDFMTAERIINTLAAFSWAEEVLEEIAGSVEFEELGAVAYKLGPIDFLETAVEYLVDQGWTAAGLLESGESEFDNFGLTEELALECFQCSLIEYILTTPVQTKYPYHSVEWMVIRSNLDNDCSNVVGVEVLLTSRLPEDKTEV